MLRSLAVTKAKRLLGFRQGTDLDDPLIEALQEAQREVEKGRTLPFFLIARQVTISLTTPWTYANLPERFLREVEDEPVYWVDTESNYVPLAKVRYQQARSYWQSQGTLSTDDQDTPLQYALLPTQIAIFPTPTTDKTFYWTYFKGAELLTSDIENVWLANYPELLIGRATALVAEDLRDANGKAKGDAMYQRWAEVMRNVEADRETAGAPIAMGSDK